MTDRRVTFRRRVLDAVHAAPAPLTGAEIAAQVAAPYKCTIDALNALYNYGLVHRLGRKFTARWYRLPDPSPQADLLRLFRTAFPPRRH